MNSFLLRIYAGLFPSTPQEVTLTQSLTFVLFFVPFLKSPHVALYLRLRFVLSHFVAALWDLSSCCFVFCASSVFNLSHLAMVLVLGYFFWYLPLQNGAIKHEAES